MPTHIEVQPDVAERLNTLAESRGLSIDELLRSVIDGWSAPRSEADALSLAEFERDMDALAEGLDHLLVEYQGTYSRADIYLDHD